jgi:hypothetical protein
MIDYYGITFDHLMPTDDPSPSVLQINIVEIEDDAGLYARIRMAALRSILRSYRGMKVLALPRCCQNALGKEGDDGSEEG